MAFIIVYLLLPGIPSLSKIGSRGFNPKVPDISLDTIIDGLDQLWQLRHDYIVLMAIQSPKKMGNQGTRFLMKALKVRKVGMKSYKC